MPHELSAITAWVKEYPWLFSIISLLVLTFVSWLANLVVKRILVRGIQHVLASTRWGLGDIISQHNFIARLSNVVPALIISVGITMIPHIPEALTTVVTNVCNAFVILTLALAIGSILNVVNALWQRHPDHMEKPIKGYIQVVKIILYALTTILIIATLIDRSPIILLSGLSAMAAVLMLIFQDTLLSLVASVQISSSEMIRVGDWVEMPQQSADGDVIDISLHTVRIQNWDKTITAVPTRKFVSDSFKNWRGMTESGGRRIKRSLYLDQNSVHFLTKAEEEHLRRFLVLGEYLDAKDHEISDWNNQLGDAGQDRLNQRRVTNIGTFRAYVEHYLHHNPRIRKDMTLLVRQLNPTAQGLPLEIYCFTNDTRWAFYEGIQSDIFDHMLAILPEFGLKVFQSPSGTDVTQVVMMPEVCGTESPVPGIALRT